LTFAVTQQSGDQFSYCFFDCIMDEKNDLLQGLDNCLNELMEQVEELRRRSRAAEITTLQMVQNVVLKETDTILSIIEKMRMLLNQSEENAGPRRMPTVYIEHPPGHTAYSTATKAPAYGTFPPPLSQSSDRAMISAPPQNEIVSNTNVSSQIPSDSNWSKNSSNLPIATSATPPATPSSAIKNSVFNTAANRSPNIMYALNMSSDGQNRSVKWTPVAPKGSGRMSQPPVDLKTPTPENNRQAPPIPSQQTYINADELDETPPLQRRNNIIYSSVDKQAQENSPMRTRLEHAYAFMPSNNPIPVVPSPATSSQYPSACPSPYEISFSPASNATLSPNISNINPTVSEAPKTTNNPQTFTFYGRRPAVEPMATASVNPTLATSSNTATKSSSTFRNIFKSSKSKSHSSDM
jgi:hypothetical protein